MLLDRRSLIGPILAALLVACASDQAQISTVFDPLAQFPATATYVWGPSRLPDNPRILDLDPDRVIKTAADRVFATRGYRRIDSGEPNFVLSYEFTVSTFISAETSLSVGSLWLLMQDARDNHRVWAGFMKAEMYVSRSEQDRVAGLEETMTRMLENFPPTQPMR